MQIILEKEFIINLTPPNSGLLTKLPMNLNGLFTQSHSEIILSMISNYWSDRHLFKVYLKQNHIEKLR